MSTPKMFKNTPVWQTFFGKMLAFSYLSCYNGFMRIVYETDKLRELMTLFCDQTAITITLFGKDMNMILDVGEWKKYCLAIGDDEERLKLCKQCDAKHAEEARKKKDIILYACHAGIGEAVAPIYLDNVPSDDSLSGYLMIGKFRDTEQKLSSPNMIKEIAAKFGLDEADLLERWEELPMIAQKQMQDAVLLLKLITNEIINGKLIHAAKTSWTESINDYIQKHLHRNITVDELCAVMPPNAPPNAQKLKRYELYARFAEYFNTSPKEHINQLRLAKALELLTTTEMSVQQIGEACGFSKVDDFTKFFKQKMNMGVTPLQYRKQKRLQLD